MSHEKLFHIGVKALIKNDKNEILILDVNGEHYGNPDARWDLPGGRIQEGQTIEDTLRREVEEETGITKLSNIELHSSVISNVEISISADQKVGLALLIYTVEVPNGVQVVLNEESVGFKWASADEAADKLSHKFPLEFTGRLRSK